MELPDPGRGQETDFEIKSENERLCRILEEQTDDLTEREIDLLDLHLRGFSSDEIASIRGESLRAIRTDKNKVVARVRYRLKAKREQADESQSKRPGSTDKNID